MAAGLNSYAGFVNNKMDGEILQNDAGFSFIDFLPEIEEPGKFFKSATFVNFR